MEQYDQISQANGKFLSNLNLRDAEQVLKTRYADAQNEMALVYEDVSKPAVSLNVSGQNSKDVEIGDAVKNIPEGTDPDSLTITHNHPNAAPLSDGDLNAAVKNNLKSVRAVGRHGVFSLERPPTGWPELRGEHLNAVNAAHAKARKDMKLDQRHLKASDVDKGAKDKELVQLEQWLMMENYAAATNAKFSHYDMSPNREHAPGRKEQLQKHLDTTYKIDPNIQASKPKKGMHKRGGSLDLP